jgi:hypothetical protein
MIRIDFGSLFEFESEDPVKKEDNRNRLRDFIALTDQYGATVVEQRDWNARDLIHFVSIAEHVTITMSVSEKYLSVQTSQIREKFKTFRAEYVSLPDRLAVSIEQPPADKLNLQEIVPCQNCGQKTPYDGFFQHCVHCGDKLNTLVKTCGACDKGVIYHPSFGFCPVCGDELKPDFYGAPPLNELDPNGLIWGIPSREDEDEDPTAPPGSGPSASPGPTI